ncbi:MAG: T9SS type A sorting domain-containing protein [Bacteroidales bacterium]|nr:T9SS type A sorting domain-containing protein [Bacteroidales bacterium]
MNAVKSLSLVLFFSIIFTTTVAQNITIGTSENSELVQNINQNGFTINLKVNKLDLLRVKHQKQVYYQLSIPSFSKSHTIGNPDLPVYRRLIEIPANASYRIEVQKMHFTIYNLKEYQVNDYLFPRQESVEKYEGAEVHFQINKNIYQVDSFYSNTLLSIDELGEMRGAHIGRLNISPVEYNPVSKQLKVYDEIEIRVVFENTAGLLSNNEKARVYSPAFQTLNSAFINADAYKIAPPTSGVQYPMKYVIVADSMYRNTLIPFIKWKEIQGYKIIEAYTSDPLVGNTNSSIKSYLQSLYNAGTVADPAPSYVLFVGDIAQIPKHPGLTNSWAADLYYCEFTNDYFPEMMYGRFSANDTSELNPQIEKIVEYEKYLMADPSFLDTSMLISGKDASYAPTYGDGQINYGTSNYFNATNALVCKSYLYINQSYNKDLEIRQNADSGLAFINYTAHGNVSGWHDPSFNSNHVANMQNAGKYPFMVGNACLTNKFDMPVCFGEALLRARNKGAIGYIGASDNTLWDEDYYWAVGVGAISSNPSYATSTSGLYDLIFHTHGEPHAQWALTAYQYLQAGNLAVTQGGSNVRRYWELYHLMGDPSMMPYRNVPTSMLVSYNPIIPLGISSFNVTTEPYALVAISRNDSLISSAFADSLGIASLYFTPFTQVGTVDIVVTASQKQPFFGTTTAAPLTGPYVVYSSHNIVDFSQNNNGQADYGEHIKLDISLENISNYLADSVHAYLQTSDTMVQITDSIQFLGAIVANDTLSYDSIFAFNVATNAVDGHLVQFNVKVTDSLNNIWNSSLYIQLHSPKISINQAMINDSQYGNGNGRFDAGETVEMWIDMGNTGSFQASNLACNLSCSYSGVSIASANYTIDTLKTDSIRHAKFDVTIDNSFIDGDIIEFDFSYTSNGFADSKLFTELVGSVDEDFETGDFNRFAWNSSDANAWLISNDYVYEGLYSSRSDSIGDNSSSSLSITLNVLSDDSISFMQRVFTEANYDVLQFSIDGIVQGTWSGVKPWKREVFSVKQGVHIFKWSYVKDAYAISSIDAAFVDKILFPPTDAWVNIEDTESQLTSIKLMPNPATDYTVLSFELDENKKADIILYDIKGQVVRIIKSSFYVTGQKQQIKIHTQDLPSGIYFVSIQSGVQRWFKKLVVL